MPNRQITIAGLVFDVEDKYAEGHAVTANEAGALNQTRAENLRNNFASVVRKAQEEVNEGNPEGADPIDLDDEAKAALREEFAKVATAYEFGVRGGGVRITDPVEREAVRLAKEQIDAAIKAKYGRLDAVDKDRYKELVADFAASDEVQAQAKANIEQANKLGASLKL